MSVLVITPNDYAKIDAMVADARKRCIPWSALQHGAAIGHDKPVLALEERKPGFERPPSQHIELGSFRVAFSFEEQPAGVCRHLSVSCLRPGKLPAQPVVAMVAEAFGFASFPPAEGLIWVEEYAPGEYAVNVVEVAEASTGTLQ